MAQRNLELPTIRWTHAMLGSRRIKTQREVLSPHPNPSSCNVHHLIVFFYSKVAGMKLGDLIIEGKTKQVFDLPSQPGHCILISKDRITAGDGVKSHALEGKAKISNKTNAKVFEILNKVGKFIFTLIILFSYILLFIHFSGLKTAFVKTSSENSFIAKKCAMIPIEWVTRRVATGSFLRRHTGVPEGYRFYPPKHETFFKDDANHDPQWSEEQIISAKFKFNGRLIGMFVQFTFFLFFVLLLSGDILIAMYYSYIYVSHESRKFSITLW